MPRRDFTRPWELQLELETSRGNHIANLQTREPVSIGSVQACENKYTREFPNIVRRTTVATGVYNCHGMVFASRRTTIYDPQEVRKILQEDGYEKVRETDVLPGDVALYVSARGAIDHSAIVIEGSLANGIVRVPKVYSKWGPWVEVIHWVNDCPYAQEPGVSVEYYRLSNPNA